MNAQRKAATSTTPARVAGRYVLGEPLGRGRSTVFRAIDTRLDRRVAVKQVELLAGQEDVERVRSRALREAQAAARLNNPRVVTVFDVVEEAGSIWLVMELVDAPSLAQVVFDGGPIPHPRAARIGLDVLTALEAAHVVGVVHRDVKPANVMVKAGDRAKLTDFGVATIRDGSRLTATGLIVGSPSYMSPEQAQGAEVGPPTDLWSLGTLLYFATEGEPPFHAGSALATASAVVHGEPRPVQYVGPLTEIIARLLSKDPNARPSAGQIRAELSRARGQRSRMRTARLPAVGPPPPVVRDAADPTPEVFPPVPAAPATSPGNPGPVVAAGKAEPDVPRRAAPEGPQTDVPPVMPGEPRPTPEGAAGGAADRVRAPARCAAGRAGAGRAAGRPAAGAVPCRARDRTRGAARRGPARPRGGRHPVRGAAQPGRERAAAGGRSGRRGHRGRTGVDADLDPARGPERRRRAAADLPAA